MKAAAEGRADWIWVMDDDAEPAPDALEALLRTDAISRPDTVGMTSLVSGPRRGPQHNHSGWYDPIRMQYRFSQPDGHAVEPVNYASFVGLLVRTAAVDAVGLPDARFFLRGDDNEYSLRLCRVGRMYLVRDSVVYHHDAFDAEGKQVDVPRWRRDRPLRDYWVQYYIIRNKLLMVHDYASGPVQHWAGLLTGTVRTLARIGAVLAFDTDKATRAQVLLRGLVDGLRNVRGKRISPAAFVASVG
jgi:GT2 family glycosyltransferase